MNGALVASFSIKLGPLKKLLCLHRDSGFVALIGACELLFSHTITGAPAHSVDEPGSSTLPILRTAVTAPADEGSRDRPRRITPGQSLPAEADGQWAEVEGEVTFVSEQKEGFILELSSSTSHMHVEITESRGTSPLLLLHSRLRAIGINHLTMNLDGDLLTGTLVVGSWDQVELLDLAPSYWAEYPPQTIGSLNTNFTSPRNPIAHLQGDVRTIKDARTLMLDDGTGNILVQTLQSMLLPEGRHVEVLGRWSRQGTNRVVSGAAFREIGPKGRSSLALPQLTRVEQIKSLSAAEAQRGYPVRVRGIVTTVLRNGFLIQDATSAVYVSLPAAPGRLRPDVSDCWEIEGTTHVGFAPSITPERMRRIGTGRMPEPLHPTWDQLINGSLDAQYVEVQGIVTWTEANEMNLLTRAGKVSIRLVEAPPQPLKGFLGALIRVRGCVIPDRNANTRQVHLGRIELSNYLIGIDEPAPTDPFSARLRRVSELRLFNWRASAIERIRTSGQVIHGRHGEYYLMDGTNGLRFLPKVPTTLPVGEQVEVVGFPGLGGPSPVLREALVRSKGLAALPAARVLSSDSLVSRQYDATLVRVQAHLVNASLNGSEQLFELRSGTYNFIARLDAHQPARRDLAAGTLLEVEGVYAGQGGDHATGRDIDYFEVLLNSAQGIRVLKEPPWWTLERVLWGLGATSLIAIVSLGWVATLKREVNRQTAVIQEKVERETVLEERTRIAREFHDTIEQQVAAVALQLQAARARLDNSPEFVRHVLQLAESMLRHAQSEARHSVWNLRAQALETSGLEDALRTVANYARNGAEVQVDVTVEGEARPLPGRLENHLLRISQEAIANGVRHGQAKNIRINLRYETDSVHLNVRDDGKGFVMEQAPSGAKGHFGLLGLRERAEKIGGNLKVTSAPGAGTEVVLSAPLPVSTAATIKNI